MSRYDTTDLPQQFLTKQPTSVPDVRRMWRFAQLAVKVGVPRTTIKSAAEVGQLRCYYTACGTPMTTLEDVWEWQLTRKFKDRRLTP